MVNPIKKVLGVRIYLPKKKLVIFRGAPVKKTPCISSKIMTKHQFQNLAWTSTSKSWPNLETLLQNIALWQNFSFKILTKPWNLVIKVNKNLTIWPNFTFQICTKLLSTRFSSSTCATVTRSTSLSCHPHMPGSHQSSLLNRSEWVSESVSQLLTSIPNDRTRVW